MQGRRQTTAQNQGTVGFCPAAGSAAGCEELEFGPHAIVIVTVSLQLTRDVSDFKYNLSVTGEFTIAWIKRSTRNICMHSRDWDSGEICAIKSTPDPDKTHCFVHRFLT